MNVTQLSCTSRLKFINRSLAGSLAQRYGALQKFFSSTLFEHVEFQRRAQGRAQRSTDMQCKYTVNCQERTRAHRQLQLSINYDYCFMYNQNDDERDGIIMHDMVLMDVANG